MAGGKANVRSVPTGELEQDCPSVSPASNSTASPESAEADRAGFNRLREAMDKVERLEQVGSENVMESGEWPVDAPLPPFMQDALRPPSIEMSLEEELAESLAAGSNDARELPATQKSDPLQQLQKACSDAVCPAGDGEVLQSAQSDEREKLPVVQEAGPSKLSRHKTVYSQHASTSILSIVAWVTLPAVIAGPLLMAKPQGAQPATPQETVAEQAQPSAILAAAPDQPLETALQSGEAVRPASAGAEADALQPKDSDASSQALSPSQMRKSGRLDAEQRSKRRDPVQVASAMKAIPALSELSTDLRADLQSRLETGECLSSALPAVLGQVPVLAMRDMIRLLEGDCQ